ncbi:hypothetical protein [Caballeronia glebae]|uniref:hypothetical protein n=1 Tax=Caballeronia glebae TaxID=1777143 RepID=UPI0038BA11F8
MNSKHPALAPARRTQDIERNVSRRAFDFLHALVATRETSPEPPPVRAAKLGLIPAWQAWTRALEERDGERLPQFHLSGAPDYGPPSAVQAAMDLFVEAMRVNGTRWDEGASVEEAVQKFALLGSAAALYQVRPHAVIEPTEALQTWLAHTDISQDVPAALLKLPFPAIFIRFGPQMAQAVDATLWASVNRPLTTSGVYVLETLTANHRELVFMAVGVTLEHEQEMPHTLQLIFDDESDSLIDHVINLERKRAVGSDSSVAMIQMCIKVLLYLQTAGAVRIDDLHRHETIVPLAPANGKKASIEQRLAGRRKQVARRYNRIIVGPAQLPAQVIHHTPGEKAPHWRAGHMRMQAHGPQHSLRKLIFIAPTLIRADLLGETDQAPH